MGKDNQVCFLPINTPPVFPDQCAQCGSPKPSSTVKFPAEGVGASRFAVPICEACAPKMRRRIAIQKWLQVGGYLAAAIVSVPAVLFFRVATTPVALTLYIILVILIVVACFVPWLVYRKRAPVPLGLVHDVLNNRDMFSFRDSEYAADFAALNGTQTGFPKKG